jgi:very-short-patch-repair endonuclease
VGDVKTIRRVVAVSRARDLRRRGADAEARLWSALRAHRLGGWKWKRQVPWGPYILDFLCVEAGLIVEADGGQHNDQVAYGRRRAAYLERSGLRVLRFWNSEILSNRDGVCLMILEACGGERADQGGEA